MKIIERILKAKHWQIFILILVLPLIIEVFIMPDLLARESVNDFRMIMAIRIILLVGGAFVWFWSIAIGLQKKMNIALKMKTRKFKVYFFITFLYFVLILGFLGLGQGFSIGSDIYYGQAPSGGFIGGVVGLIVPLLFPIYCLFYFFYFTSKSIKTFELNSTIKISDYIGFFFGIWFLPIGIWIIQPKVNRLIQNNEKSTKAQQNL